MARPRRRPSVRGDMTMGADRVRRMTVVEKSEAGPAVFSGSDGTAPQGVELRHLRYFVAVAGAGPVTHAAGEKFIAQPTPGQQNRGPVEVGGDPPVGGRRGGARRLQRGGGGVRLTGGGGVLLGESGMVLPLIERGVSGTRQTAGLGRPRLRFVMPPYLPEALAVEAASRLRTTAAAAGVDVA